MRNLDLNRISRKIAYLLRHAPGFTTSDGYADVSALVSEVRKNHPGFNRVMLDEIVRTDDKGRYSYDAHKQRIRANQGHSVPVDVGLVETPPPEILYHGTATRFLDSIFQQGLTGQTRMYVHLSGDQETAVKVGSRHGKPVVLQVMAGKMHRNGIAFYRSENGIWMTKSVPPQFLQINNACDGGQYGQTRKVD